MTVPLPDGAQAVREQLLELLRAQALTGARVEVLLSAGVELDPAQTARAAVVAARHRMDVAAGEVPGTLRFVGTAAEVAELLRAAVGQGRQP